MRHPIKGKLSIKGKVPNKGKLSIKKKRKNKITVSSKPPPEIVDMKKDLLDYLDQYKSNQQNKSLEKFYETQNNDVYVFSKEI